MARGVIKKSIRHDPELREDDEVEPDDRTEELADREDVETELRELYAEIEAGFEGQYGRANETMKYWDLFNCRLSGEQYYIGTSKIFVPVIHDAVQARVTRFSNQIFPTNGRFIEVTTMDGTIPHGEMSLVEHYIRKAQLRTVVIPALLKNGDIEGQYNVYVDWRERKRRVAYKKPRPELMQQDDEAPPDDIVQETIREGRPYVEVIADADVLVLPQTADTIDEAIASGGSVTILRRWSKSKIKQLVADEKIRKEEGERLYKEMTTKESATTVDKSKIVIDAAGIKTGLGGAKHALVYETWVLLTIDGERRICQAFFAGDKNILTCKRNPNWSDKINLFSAPVDKVQGVFKGVSKLKPCEQMQYYANDAVNEAADSSMFSMMPIVMTDPERNPRIGTMVLNLAAVWECDPNSTTFAKFPDLWKQGFEIVASNKSQILQTLSVSPAAITQNQTQKAKPSQADVAREQQVDILTTADAVTIVEGGILTPVVDFMVDLDHQHRNEKMLIPMYGEKGLRAKMDWVPPLQMGNNISYRWFGVEQARTAMQMQQQIAGLNVVAQMSPDKYPGHRINLVPFLEQMMENLFGPRLAPLIFEDEKAQLTIQADVENKWMVDFGINLAVHPMDEDPQHLQEHAKVLQATGDPTGNIRAHMSRHQVQLQAKQQAALAAQVAQVMGGGGGGPRPGGQARPPRGGQGPAGMIHRDQIGPASGTAPQLRGRM